MFSNSTKYAIRTVIFLADRKKEEELKKYKADELAEALNIPKPYLSKILQQLAKNQIISSTKGPGGGFFLNDENIRRPLLDVITCIEGYNVFGNCILGLPQCSDTNPCGLHNYYKTFKQEIQYALTNFSIENMPK